MSDFSVHPVYLSARAAIVAPERAIPVTLYATQKWLPRLGPERWCLVMLLRSMCIDAQRRNDGTKRVTVSWRQLAQNLDVHEETVASWLKHEPIPNDKPWRRIIPVDEKAKSLSLFIPRLRYAYETRNGKTRRTGFLLEILMEDYVVPEDEARLHKQMELLRLQQGELGLETYRSTEDVSRDNIDLPQSRRKQENPDLHYVNQKEADLPSSPNPVQLGLHNQSVNPDKPDLRPNVKQENTGLDSYVNQPNSELLDHKSDISGKNVNELDILIQQLKQKQIKKSLRREAFEPVIRLTESLLEDTHSTAMLHKVLNILYPQRLDLYVAAVKVSLEAAEDDPHVNRGAVFVRALRDFAEVAGIDLGFKRSSTEQSDDQSDNSIAAGNLGSQPLPPTSSLTPPSVNEAIWAETQLMLRRQMTRATYDAIIQGTVLVGHDENRYLVGVQTEMAKQWLENRLRDIVQRALSSVVGRAIQVEFILMQGES